MTMNELFASVQLYLLSSWFSRMLATVARAVPNIQFDQTSWLKQVAHGFGDSIVCTAIYHIRDFFHFWYTCFPFYLSKGGLWDRYSQSPWSFSLLQRPTVVRWKAFVYFAISSCLVMNSLWIPRIPPSFQPPWFYPTCFFKLLRLIITLTTASAVCFLFWISASQESNLRS